MFCLACHQVIGTAALLLCVLALGDQRNTPLPDALQPVLVGAAVLVIGISMGSNSGYAINPARDIGPRLFTYFIGWGADVFTSVATKWLLTLPHHSREGECNYNLSLQGWEWLVVGACSGSLCRGPAGSIDLRAGD